MKHFCPFPLLLSSKVKTESGFISFTVSENLKNNLLCKFKLARIFTSFWVIYDILQKKLIKQ